MYYRIYGIDENSNAKQLTNSRGDYVTYSSKQAAIRAFNAIVESADLTAYASVVLEDCDTYETIKKWEAKK